MARLLDDIRAAGKLVMPWFVDPRHEEDWIKASQFLWPMLNDRDLIVLLLDNVADYYYTSDQEYWDLGRDFPNLAPPYEQFWFEHRLPSRIHSKEKGDSDMSHLIRQGRLGGLITALDPANVRGEGIPEATRWILWCELFIDYGRLSTTGGITGPHGATYFCIDEHGALLERPWMQSYAPPSEAEHMRAYMTWFHPAMLAISFLHCKNVSVLTERMPPPLAKKFRAKHPGVEPTAYRTLVIEPLKQILRKEGQSEEVGLKRALHICRGHFRITARARASSANTISLSGSRRSCAARRRAMPRWAGRSPSKLNQEREHDERKPNRDQRFNATCPHGANGSHRAPRGPHRKRRLQRRGPFLHHKPSSGAESAGRARM